MDIPPLVHQVFFWLKHPDSETERAELIAGIRSLTEIEGVRGLHVGVPARTEKRDVVDQTYSVSELLFFDSLEAQKAYQDHPRHMHFIQQCGHLWSRVLVYDAVAAE